MQEIDVKGRAQPVVTYEVLGLNGEAPLPVSERARTLPVPAQPQAEVPREGE